MARQKVLNFQKPKGSGSARRCETLAGICTQSWTEVPGFTSCSKNAAIAKDNFDSSAVLKQLYPDQETYK